MRIGAETMSTATDVARFLVQYYIDIKKSVTNMKLQKLLYYAWIEYYSSHDGRYLFNDEIYAWKLGPVVPDVYREYRIFAAMPISMTRGPDGNIDEDTREFLKSFADRYKNTKAMDLVNRSHAPGKPWEKAYSKGHGDTAIPFKSIIALECQKN